MTAGLRWRQRPAAEAIADLWWWHRLEARRCGGSRPRRQLRCAAAARHAVRPLELAAAHGGLADRQWRSRGGRGRAAVTASGGRSNGGGARKLFPTRGGAIVAQRTSGTPLNLAEPGACVDFSGSFTGTAAAVFCAIRYSRMGTGPHCEQPYMVLNLILQKDDMSSN